MSAEAVLSIHRDRQSRLWVGTFGGGLNLLDPSHGTFRHYLPRSGDPRSLADANIWDILQLERYIDERSDATFSHGICPDCMKTLYPEIEIDPKDP